MSILTENLGFRSHPGKLNYYDREFPKFKTEILMHGSITIPV
jgi:hypothetical protein